MSQSVNNLVALALALTPSGEIGDGMVARFHQLAREVIDEGKTEVTGTDAALAIGEHAFRAGFKAGYFTEVGGLEEEAKVAWSEYDPPEDIKALTGELSGEPVAWAYELAHSWKPETGFSDWRKHISFAKPYGKPNQIRNLKALR